MLTFSGNRLHSLYLLKFTLTKGCYKAVSRDKVVSVCNIGWEGRILTAPPHVGTLFCLEKDIKMKHLMMVNLKRIKLNTNKVLRKETSMQAKQTVF